MAFLAAGKRCPGCPSVEYSDWVTKREVASW